MKYYFHIFGCQMNEADAEVLAGFLVSMGYSRAESESEADIILLITCCVREHAESRVYGKLGELARLKQLKPSLVVGISGCMPQQADVAESLRVKFPYLDLIFGTHNLPDFPRLLEEAQAHGGQVLEVVEEGEVRENLPRVRQIGLKAWVSIMYGCNNYCTYCIVPYVRGRERSRLPEAILAEIRELTEQGCLEVTLLGQNVNSYGRGLAPQLRVDFADLLAAVDKVPGMQRVRFMTSHPRDFSDKLIETVFNSSSVCEHFHLPVQSGSNQVLARMNRGYTRETYLELVHKLRAAIPHAAITTDIIVGFPGETEQDFSETLDLVREVAFDSVFAFAYSARSGTPAADFAPQLPKAEKSLRLKQLIDTANAIALVRNQKLADKVVEVLVEGPSKTNPDRLTGRTRTNKLVHLDSEPDLVGKLLDVRITRVQTFSMLGERTGVER
ncbi:MAG: tRNA-2-methylthio-N(6)-dimethylallyladenosine synthase [Firmicutes bacterium]|nr:tRNA-2-methylthio-N(6)-dimethylallyladenosine synthase [Bacillota bacterium]